MEQEVIRESLDSGHGSSILLQMSLARTPQQMENSLVSLLTIHSLMIVFQQYVNSDVRQIFPNSKKYFWLTNHATACETFACHEVVTFLSAIFIGYRTNLSITFWHAAE
jgi:hypothetical protein